MATVHHYTTSGRFYLGRNDKQQQVVLVTPYGTVSQLWDDGEAGYDEDMDAEEVLNLLSERLESFWINTSREETRAKISAIRERMAEVNCLWHKTRAVQLQDRISRLSKQARRHADLSVPEEA